jgi:Flp pilus assembly protein TadB
MEKFMSGSDGLLIAVVLLTGSSLLTRRNEVRHRPMNARLASLRSNQLEFAAQPTDGLARENARRNHWPTWMQWIVKRRAILGVMVLVTTLFGMLWGGIGITAWIVLQVMSKARARAAERKVLRFGLVDLVDDVSRQLRGGRSVTSALVEAIADSSEDLQRVLAPVTASLTIGTPPSKAIAQLGIAFDHGDLHSLATLLGAGERLGGVRPDALDGLATMMRERSAAGADVQTQAAQARVSAMVLGCAPIVFCGLLVLGDGRSSAFLLHSPIGLACGVLGLFLDGCGAVWMSTVTRRAMA